MDAAIKICGKSCGTITKRLGCAAAASTTPRTAPVDAGTVVGTSNSSDDKISNLFMDCEELARILRNRFGGPGFLASPNLTPLYPYVAQTDLHHFTAHLHSLGDVSCLPRRSSWTSTQTLTWRLAPLRLRLQRFGHCFLNTSSTTRRYAISSGPNATKEP